MTKKYLKKSDMHIDNNTTENQQTQYFIMNFLSNNNFHAHFKKQCSFQKTIKNYPEKLTNQIFVDLFFLV